MESFIRKYYTKEHKEKGRNFRGYVRVEVKEGGKTEEKSANF
jgi:hypothetical protein